jgi:drug/metabolite transporter (DMT)-like permease
MYYLFLCIFSEYWKIKNTLESTWFQSLIVSIYDVFPEKQPSRSHLWHGLLLVFCDSIALLVLHSSASRETLYLIAFFLWECPCLWRVTLNSAKVRGDPSVLPLPASWILSAFHLGGDCGFLPALGGHQPRFSEAPNSYWFNLIYIYICLSICFIYIYDGMYKYVSDIHIYTYISIVPGYLQRIDSKTCHRYQNLWMLKSFI